MAATNAKVLFCYVPTGKTKPSPVDENTIYFLADSHEIHVGSAVIARDVEGSIPTFNITGSGDYISNASYDSSTHVLTLTKGTLPVYTITKQSTAESGYAATYQLFKDNVAVGDKINIPKDMVVTNAELKTVTTPDVPYEGAQVGDKYIDITIANAAQSHIYLPVNDLVDTYTGGTHITIDGSNAINHDSQGTDASTPLGTDNTSGTGTGAIHVSGQVEYDSLGHVISVADKNIYSAVEDVAGLVSAAAINALDVNEVGGSGKYITAISQTDGSISASAGTADTTVTSASTNLVTSGAVYTAVENATPTWTVVTT